jgi:hypothetical protein
MYKAFISVYFVSEGQIIQPLTAIGQVFTEQKYLCCLMMNLTNAIVMICFQLKRKRTEVFLKKLILYANFTENISSR